MLLDKDIVLSVLEKSRYVSDALASIRMMGAVRAEWIPCSERLPENEQIVLLTIKSTLSDDFYVTEALVGRIVNEDSVLNGVRFYTKRYGDINEQHGFKVIAWMPLPEPYKGVKYEV